MTMPNERTRALIWAREFLLDARAQKLTLEELAHQAHVILRHYPSLQELDDMGAESQLCNLPFAGGMLTRIKDGKAVDDFPVGSGNDR